MEFFKKVGSKVEVGCFVLILIGIFLPFVATPSNNTFILTYNPTTFIGVMGIMAALFGGALVGVEAFARDIYDRISSKRIDSFVNYAPLIIAENILVVTLVMGLVFSSDALVHMGAGTIIVIVASAILTIFAFERKIVYKDLLVSSKDNVQVAVSDKPVMQPLSQEVKVTVSKPEEAPALTPVMGTTQEEKPVLTPVVNTPTITPVRAPKVEAPIPEAPKIETPVVPLEQPKEVVPQAPETPVIPLTSVGENKEN